MSECPIQDKQVTFRMIWTKRFFVLSLVLLGIVFSLQSVGILEFPVTSTDLQRKQIKPVRVGGLLCQEPVWDFGTVDSVKNSRLSHEFVLVNESKETVTIQKIHSTCGCMVAEDFDKELAPDKSTKIKVNVQLPPTPQLFHKNLAVQTDKGVVPLDVRGEIAANSSMFCIPEIVNFGSILSGETKERTVRVFRYDSSPIEFSDASGSVEAIIWNCKYNIQQEKKHEVLINIHINSRQLKLGTFTGHLNVRTKNKFYSEIKIPIFVFVEPDDTEQN